MPQMRTQKNELQMNADINANIFSKKVAKAIFLICEDIGYDSIYLFDWQLQKQLREAILSAPSQSS